MSGSSDDLHEIVIENVGPIEGIFTIQLDGPGVYELTGDKGIGKSSVLASLELLAGHRVDLTVNDGELSGEVRGFGVVAPIGSKQRRRGEFEMSTLDSERFSISDVTDPQIKSPIAADAHRIKALASLCGAKADPAVYHDLVGGPDQFEQLVEAKKLVTDDPVLLASRVKESFESAARLAESREQIELSHAAACAEQFKEVDLEAPHDAATLAQAAEMAAAELRALNHRKTDAETAKREAAHAQHRLAQTRSAYTGPTLEQAKATVESAERVLVDRRTDLEQAEKALAAAQKLCYEAQHRVWSAAESRTSALQLCDAADLQASTVTQLEDLISSRQAVEPPTEDEIAAATAARDAAREANVAGMKIREAMSAKDRQSAHLDKANVAHDEAASLRAAATGTFQKLTEGVRLRVLRVESVQGDPRLVVDHKKRGKTLYGDLSDGERVRIAMDVLTGYIGSPGVFPISQRLWQDLPQSDRQHIDQYAREKGLFVFGAQVSDGPLRVRRYSAVAPACAAPAGRPTCAAPAGRSKP